VESRITIGAQHDQLIVRFVFQENILHGTGIIRGTVSSSVRIVLQGSIQVPKHIHALSALILSINQIQVVVIAQYAQEIQDTRKQGRPVS
jgi:hypothetical protein